MSLLGIIPARGGSKGIYRKNIKELFGKPLIAWTIEVAQQVTKIDKIFVSTDDEEIAEIAEDWGVSVPFLRPSEIATDDTTSISTALHVLEVLTGFEEILWLQPTSPFRTVEDVNNLLKLTKSKKTFSVTSVCPVKANLNWMYKLNDHHVLTKWIDEPTILTRQALPQSYIPNGAIYWAQVDWLKKNKTFISNETLGYVMSVDRSIDIDTPLDWQWAEFLMNRK